MGDEETAAHDRVAFSYVEEDYRAMLRWYHWVHKRAWTLRTVTLLGLILFGASAGVYLFFVWMRGEPWPSGGQAFGSAVTGLVLAFALSALVFVYALKRQAARIHGRMTTDEAPEAEIRLTESGVELRHGDESTRLGWDDFEAVERTNEFVFLVLGAEQAIGVPTRAFRDETHVDSFFETARDRWAARRPML